MQAVVTLATLLGLAGFVTAQNGFCNSSLKEVADKFTNIQSSSVVQIADFSIHFKCPKGWTLNGAEHAVCSSNCTTSTMSIPTCIQNVCNNTELLTDASISDSPTFVGKNDDGTFNCGGSITYSCKEGFELVGNPVHICQEDRSWLKKDFDCKKKPTCKEEDLCKGLYASRCFISERHSGCLDAYTKHSNRIFYPGDRVNYTKCGSNDFTMCGPTVVTCLQSGKWSDCPTCKVNVLCSVSRSDLRTRMIEIMRSNTTQLLNMDSDIVQVQGGKGLNFCCENKSLEMFGDPHIHCQCETGNWSPGLPYCIYRIPPVCEYGECHACMKPSRLEEFLYSITPEENSKSPSKQYSARTVITIQECKNGYARGPDRKRFECVVSSLSGKNITNWDTPDLHVTLPMCEKDCEYPNEAFNGHRWVNDSNPAEDRWNKTKEPNHHYPGSVITYTCYEGTRLCKGEKTRTCVNGKWTGVEPECCPVQCCLEPICATVEPVAELAEVNEIRTRYNGRRQYDVTRSIAWACRNGYTNFQGIKTTTCVYKDGEIKWDHEPGNCTLDKPQVLRTPGGAAKAMRFCRMPTTPRYGVEAVSRVNVLLSNDDTRFEAGDIISYSCQKPLFIHGNHNITCQVNGRWSGQPPQCVADPYCAKPDVATNATVLFITMALPNNPEIFTVDTTIYFECPGDQYLVGKDYITCRLDGSWSGEPGYCLPRQGAAMCPAPREPNNGRLVSLSSDEHLPGSRLVYECDEGYGPASKTTLTCQLNGTWSPAEPPRCEAKTGTPKLKYCSMPQQPANLLIAYGDLMTIENSDLFVPGGEIVYRCQEGYSAIGQHRITCKEDGSWSSETPQCVRTLEKMFFPN